MQNIVEWLIKTFPYEIRVVHELKIWPEQYDAIQTRKKCAEVRRCDRDFQVGDLLYLKEYDPKTMRYTGRQLFREITHITPGGMFGLPEDLCVLSVQY